MSNLWWKSTTPCYFRAFIIFLNFAVYIGLTKIVPLPKKSCPALFQSCHFLLMQTSKFSILFMPGRIIKFPILIPISLESLCRTNQKSELWSSEVRRLWIHYRCFAFEMNLLDARHKTLNRLLPLVQCIKFLNFYSCTQICIFLQLLLSIECIFYHEKIQW